MGGFSLSEGRVKLVCRTLQTVPDILYGLMNGLITCRYAPACRVRGRSRPNGRLLGACPAPPCSCPASAQSRGGPASAPARPRESYCLNNLRSEKLRSCRAPEPGGRKCGNSLFGYFHLAFWHFGDLGTSYQSESHISGGLRRTRITYLSSAHIVYIRRPWLSPSQSSRRHAAAMSASTSAARLGALAVSTSGGAPSARTKTSSSMRMPIPLHQSGSSGSLVGK